MFEKLKVDKVRPLKKLVRPFQIKNIPGIPHAIHCNRKHCDLDKSRSVEYQTQMKR